MYIVYFGYTYLLIPLKTFFFEIGSYVAQLALNLYIIKDDLELLIHLLLPPNLLDNRHMSP